MNFPEVAATLSGGGFSENFERPEYQRNAVGGFLIEFSLETDSDFSFFKYARCCDLTFVHFVICVALTVVVTPTLPRNRKISKMSSMMRSTSGTVHPSRFRCVFPCSIVLLLGVFYS